MTPMTVNTAVKLLNRKRALLFDYAVRSDIQSGVGWWDMIQP